MNIAIYIYIYIYICVPKSIENVSTENEDRGKKRGEDSSSSTSAAPIFCLRLVRCLCGCCQINVSTFGLCPHFMWDWVVSGQNFNPCRRQDGQRYLTRKKQPHPPVSQRGNLGGFLEIRPIWHDDLQKWKAFKAGRNIKVISRIKTLRVWMCKLISPLVVISATMRGKKVRSRVVEQHDNLHE